jgi:hypothetical protein
MVTLLPRTQKSYPEPNYLLSYYKTPQQQNNLDNPIAAIVWAAVQVDTNTGACRLRTETL